MSYKPDGCGEMGIEEMLNQNFSVFPIPTSNKLYAQINGEKITAYELISIEGKKIDSKRNLNLSVLELNTSSYIAGTYILNVTSPKGIVQKKVIIE